MHYVLGVDPGTTTGLAIISVGPAVVEVPWYDQLSWRDASNAVPKLFKGLTKRADRGSGEVIIAVEKFTITPQTARRGQQGAEDALGMIGVIRHYCEELAVPMAPTETASSAKNLVSDAVLRKLELYRPGNKHVNDAMRHAVLAAHKQGWITGKQMMPV